MATKTAPITVSELQKKDSKSPALLARELVV